MPPRKILFQIVGILCIIFTFSGALMYPLNTYNIFWIILYEMTVIPSSIGIVYLIYSHGFSK